MTPHSNHVASSRTVWWADEEKLKIIFQALFVGIAIAVLLTLFRNLQVGLERNGLTLTFSFLNNAAGFQIDEGLPYESSDSYLWAFVVGAVNTIWVSLISIILATAMGFLLGIARLSSNWLAQRLATVVTEIFRNIPVLLIIYFWYLAVLLQLPTIRESYSFFDVVFVSQRGINFPSLIPSIWLFPLMGCLITVGWVTRRLRPDRSDRVQWSMTAAGAVVIVVLFWILAPTPPLQFDVPVLDRFNFQGGWRFSTEFMGLMLGLVTYTGSYIAEVVRGGFLAVPRGQWEAARAIGFSELSTFQLVVVPQALRIMLPSLTTQFLTLIKNTSLAVQIGYTDLFNVGQTVINQAGRSVEVFAMIIGTYLVINLVVSYGLNWFNHRVKLVER